MSTNYYLINKKEKAISENLNTLIDAELHKLEESLKTFNIKNELETEEEIEEKISVISNTLHFGIFNVEEILICTTINLKLIWKTNNYFATVKEFIQFFKENKEKYDIENEYGEIFTLESFIKDVILKYS